MITLLIIEDKTSSNSKYKYSVKINSIKLPIKKGQVVGKVNVLENNKIVSTGNLISSENVSSMNYLELMLKVFKDIVSGTI